MTPESLSTKAIAALSLIQGVRSEALEKWRPVLPRLINEAIAHDGTDKLTRMAWLDMPIPHPANNDLTTTAGEALQLFGLIVSWRRGPLWDAIRNGEFVQQENKT
jgi:hypothetical protein